MKEYLPEGKGRRGNMRIEEILGAMERGDIIEARVTMCDRRYNLHVELGEEIYGLIPREESQLPPEGEGIKDIAILTRVGKTVAVKVIDVRMGGGAPFFILSRRMAQAECMREYIDRLLPGDVIPARITHLESFGAFLDVGCGICSLLSIDSISVSRISHPSARLAVGDYIFVVVKGRDERGRIYASFKELLGSWEENAALFKEGETVRGIVRSVESYGVFVELCPNLAGLAEWREDAECGQVAAVFIKAIIPEKMKVKLVIIDTQDGENAPVPPRYFIDTGEVRHIDRWRYSPASCKRVIESVF